jgi:hypothetical protein
MQVPALGSHSADTRRQGKPLSMRETFLALSPVHRGEEIWEVVARLRSDWPTTGPRCEPSRKALPGSSVPWTRSLSTPMAAMLWHRPCLVPSSRSWAALRACANASPGPRRYNRQLGRQVWQRRRKVAAASCRPSNARSEAETGHHHRPQQRTVHDGDPGVTLGRGGHLARSLNQSRGLSPGTKDRDRVHGTATG